MLLWIYFLSPQGSGELSPVGLSGALSFLAAYTRQLSSFTEQQMRRNDATMRRGSATPSATGEPAAAVDPVSIEVAAVVLAFTRSQGLVGISSLVSLPQVTLQLSLIFNIYP